VGVGNLLLKDEGIGVHVAHALKQMGLDNGRNLDILDGGTCPDVILSLDSVEKLIIVDAAEGNCEPGTIYRFRPGDVTGRAEACSAHEVSLSHSLMMLDALGVKPKDVVIFGIQPKEVDWGLEPSVELAERIPEIARLVVEETTKC
jgi:hydrogenase maturation protease